MEDLEPVPVTDLDLTVARRMVELERLIREGKALLTVYTSEYDKLSEVMATQFENAGVQRVSVDGKTVYLREDLFAQRLGDEHALVLALRDADMEDYVLEKWDSSGLSAEVRGWVKLMRAKLKKEGNILTDLNQAIPENLRGVLKVARKLRARVKN